MKTGDLVELCFGGPRHRGIVISGRRSLGWFMILFFDGDEAEYREGFYEWNKKFWKVLNES
jgi:uncharacterized protein YodC (DUF2158 family)